VTERSIDPLGSTVYVAPQDHEDELRRELGQDATELGPRLFAAPGPPRPVMWALDTWIDPVRIRFGATIEGANALRALGRRWVHFPVRLFRRAALIEREVPALADEPIPFPAPR